MTPLQRSLGCALIFRILEFILCATCLGLCIHMLDCNAESKALFTYIISIITAAFLFITFLDLIALCTPTPIPWTIWLLVCAMAASFFFYVCGELTDREDLSTAWYWTYVGVFGSTGLIYLLELFCLIGLVISYYAQETAVRRYAPVERDTRVIHKREESPLHLEQVKEEEVEKEIEPLQSVNAPTVNRCTRDCCEKLNRFTTSSESESNRSGMKKNSSSITSHGGTFHVSKQVAPLASPTSSRYKTCQSTSTRKSIEEVKRKTYSTSAKPLRTVPKPKERKISTAPVKTNESVASRSSFRYQNVEKVQVHASTEPTQKEEMRVIAEEERVESKGQVAAYVAPGIMTYECTRCGRWFGYYRRTVRVNTGLLVYLCLRCNRCFGYYFPSAGGSHTYTYAKPSTSYQEAALDVTPTKDCCPCTPPVRQGTILAYPPPPTVQRVGTSTSRSTSDSDHFVVVTNQGTSSSGGYVRRSSADSQSDYNTTFVNRGGYK